MTKQDVFKPSAAQKRALIEAIKPSIQYGDFNLKSGQKSNWLVNLKGPVLQGRAARTIAGGLYKATREFVGVQFIGGVAMGAIPLVTSVVMLDKNDWLRGFYVRPEPKDHGTKNLIDGNIPPAGVEVIMVEDVATTGGSLTKAVDVLAEQQVATRAVITVLDRSGGEAEALFAERGIQFRALLTAADLGLQ